MQTKALNLIQSPYTRGALALIAGGTFAYQHYKAHDMDEPKNKIFIVAMPICSALLAFFNHGKVTKLNSTQPFTNVSSACVSAYYVYLIHKKCEPTLASNTYKFVMTLTVFRYCLNFLPLVQK